jgi:hypothetical protein
MARSDPQVNIRMQPDLKVRLEAAAEASGRSLNAELVARLQQSLEVKSDIASLPAGALLEELVKRFGAQVQIVVSKEAADQAGIGPTK